MAEETDTSEQVWLTREEAAERARVHPRTLDKWSRDGRVPKFKAEGLQSVRYRPEDIDAVFKPEPITGSIPVSGQDQEAYGRASGQ